MPDPKALRVGDRIRFVSLPDGWQDPAFTVHEDDIEFMKIMIGRGWSSRVCRIDEGGTPWIDARIRTEGEMVYHSWAIFEKSGWRLVHKRA